VLANVQAGSTLRFGLRTHIQADGRMGQIRCRHLVVLGKKESTMESGGRGKKKAQSKITISDLGAKAPSPDGLFQTRLATP